MCKKVAEHLGQAQERMGVSPPFLCRESLSAKNRGACTALFLRARAQRAFTLVELLVVGAIIVILAALTLFVMGKVANSTKEAKTRTTIQKIDVAMQQIFESYEDRFTAIKSRVAQDYLAPAFTEADRQKIAAHFIRDTMRMEMPQSWTEVYDSTNPANPLGPISIRIAGKAYSVEESPLLSFYWQAYQASGKPPGQAALLFLIIQNLNPEALEAFHGNEVADTDGDGLLEFVDAWGNPIRFLRWAPAFSDSDVQTPDQPDMTDEREDAAGFFLYPLIYSAGPDGKYGIEDGDGWGSPTVGSEGILDPFERKYGAPLGSEHFDNIHNHRWYRSF